MGNHEYCIHCGMSDFHRGQTCAEAYPKQYREHQRRERALHAKQERGRRALRRLAKLIRRQFKVNVDIETFEGKDNHIRIHYWHALEASEEHGVF